MFPEVTGVGRVIGRAVRVSWEKDESLFDKTGVARDSFFLEISAAGAFVRVGVEDLSGGFPPDEAKIRAKAACEALIVPRDGLVVSVDVGFSGDADASVEVADTFPAVGMGNPTD